MLIELLRSFTSCPGDALVFHLLFFGRIRVVEHGQGNCKAAALPRVASEARTTYLLYFLLAKITYNWRILQCW